MPADVAMQSEPQSFREFLKGHRELAPFTPSASSADMGWAGLQAVRYTGASDWEIQAVPLPVHRLVMITRPPRELYLKYDDFQRESPTAPGWISVHPANQTVLWRWKGPKDSLHIFLHPEAVERVAAETFGLNPGSILSRPLDGPDCPELRGTMRAIGAELASGGLGVAPLVESLANVLAVHLLRYLKSPRLSPVRRDGVLPRRKLHAVAEYIWENLDSQPTLEQMASLVHLSPHHFARQFKQTTGVPPHQYVIARRIERSQQLLQEREEISLAEVALRTGFADQSHFNFHFKRMVGVTPRQFRRSARIS